MTSTASQIKSSHCKLSRLPVVFYFKRIPCEMKTCDLPPATWDWRSYVRTWKIKVRDVPLTTDCLLRTVIDLQHGTSCSSLEAVPHTCHYWLLDVTRVNTNDEFRMLCAPLSPLLIVETVVIFLDFARAYTITLSCFSYSLTSSSWLSSLGPSVFTESLSCYFGRTHDDLSASEDLD